MTRWRGSNPFCLLAGLVWAVKGAMETGTDALICLGVASILLALALVLHELAKWRRL